ncbi:acyltransferase family protein [Curtobacterium sp. RRHDQ10]|uniref:acyltransferase family protein n=1 Tax=Curtobacterium phyllosphaerae TaxID=3413379 RepID=UPI003BF2E22F
MVAQVRRLDSLDALRGLAAGVVLLHHASMSIPAIARAYGSSRGVEPWSIGWWATESPLKILVAGPEFVLVFFVLSGFVLTRSVLQRPRYDWVAYYPRRITRLVLPALASVLFAVGLGVVLPRHASAATGWLADQGDPDTSPGALLAATGMLFGKKYPDINPPLWSLTWETWFSLLLPVAVVIGLLSRRVTAGWLVALTGLSMAGYVIGSDAASYLPAFALGALLAANEPVVRDLGARFAGLRWSPLWWTLAAVAAVVLLTMHWSLRPVLADAHLSAIFGKSTLALRVPGAFLLVLVAWLWPAARRALGIRPLQWLGRVSFSLYLVHFPIVVGIAFLFPADQRWTAAFVAVALSLVVAQGMYIAVERPSQRIARTVGRWASVTVHQAERLRDAPVRVEPAPRLPAGPDRADLSPRARTGTPSRTR